MQAIHTKLGPGQEGEREREKSAECFRPRSYEENDSTNAKIIFALEQTRHIFTKPTDVL